MERQAASCRQSGNVAAPGREFRPPAARFDELALRRAHRRQDDRDLPPPQQIERPFKISEIAGPVDHRRDVLLAGDLAHQLGIEIRRRLVAVRVPEAGLRPQGSRPAQVVERLRVEHDRDQCLAPPRNRRELPVDWLRRRPGREHEIVEFDHDPPDTADIDGQCCERRQFACHQGGEAGIVDAARLRRDVARIEAAIDHRGTDQQRLRLQPRDLERLDQAHLDIEQAAHTGTVASPGRVVAKHPIGIAPKGENGQKPHHEHHRRRETGGKAPGSAGRRQGGGAHGAALADRPNAGEPA